MNITDKNAFYREIHRVLKPGGWLALSKIAKGEGVELDYPTPWAMSTSTSFLSTLEEMGDLLADAEALLAASSRARRRTVLRRPTTQRDFHATTSPADAGRAFHHRPRSRTARRQAQPIHSQHGAHQHE